MDDYTSKSWQNACEGPYHQYLEYLSPDYNNILIYSRYGQKFWFADPEQNLALQRRSPLHSVHVIDLGDADNKVAKFQCGLEYIRRNIDKIDFLSELTLLREHICSPADSDNVKVFMRVILVPNLMGPLIETLGAALSLEPDVFSYHIGSAYKSMGQYSKEVIAGSNADRMTQESGWRRARLPTADVVVSRDSAQYSAFDRELKTGTGCTITIWLPRTLCVQSSTMDLNLVTEMWEKEMKQILLLQERLLFRRFGQFRSIPSYEGLDRRVKFTQLGIEILQRITVHVRRYANGDILYALVCLPPRNSSNVPNVTIFEDPLPVDSAKWSFNEYWKERQSREPRRDTKGHDEIENISQAVGSISPGNGFDQLHGLLDLLHSYAARSWFQRLRILEDHLDTLDRSLSMRNPQNCVCPYTASDLEEVGKGVLRYIESIKDSIVTLELQLADDPRCSLDDSQGNPRRDHSKNQELLTKFRYLQSKMSMLSVRAEHLLSAQRTQAQTTLTELQIEESRKSIQQAETVKRYAQTSDGAVKAQHTYTAQVDHFGFRLYPAVVCLLSVRYEHSRNG
ncbi:MAG: hypothetical protein M1828_003886 [Chrysothrix sp. TS-e1954]|nr:MAG: hypothetical protein M1828_003886 [Chrysothrix sp. TS-e1954]